VKARGVRIPPAINTLRSQGSALWQGMAARERIALVAGLTVLFGFFIWLIFVAPAWRTVRDAPAELDRLEVQLQNMQRLSTESRTLKVGPPITVAQAVEPVKAATDRLDGKGTVSIQGDRASLTLTNVSGDALRDWLSEVRSAARARPVDVQLTRTPQGYSGIVVVTLGAGT
jgi:general secretion pathway protein M